MRRGPVFLACSLLVLGAVRASAGGLANPGFEEDLGSAMNLDVWGPNSAAWGAIRLVDAETNGPLVKAHEGRRALCINVPPDTWNGIWQQVAWPEKEHFRWEAYYLITGDLPENCKALMKVEFYDAGNRMVGEQPGRDLTADTHGKWVKETIEGKPVKGTAFLRLALMAGDNAGNLETVADRIFWDSASLRDGKGKER